MVHWKLDNKLTKFTLEACFGLIQGSLASLLADIGPSTLNAGHCPLIDRLHVYFYELDPLSAVHYMSIDRLRLDPLQHRFS